MLNSTFATQGEVGTMGTLAVLCLVYNLTCVASVELTSTGYLVESIELAYVEPLVLNAMLLAYLDETLETSKDVDGGLEALPVNMSLATIELVKIIETAKATTLHTTYRLLPCDGDQR